MRFSNISEEEGYKLKSKFEIKHTRWFLFWGLLSLNAKNLDQILFTEFKDNEKEAVGNLVIKEYYSFGDAFLSILVYGLVRPYSVSLTGDLYERTQPSSASNFKEIVALKNGVILTNVQTQVTSDSIIVTEQTGVITIYKKSEVISVRKK